MASAITLKGIDQAISILKYKNTSTLKYRFVHYIREYYTREDCVESLKKIDPAELIKNLWDTDGSLEEIKNKRKNLNSIRSSVNSDLKKLYEKGGNPEGIKISSDNIFIMSEDAKDNILEKFGYDLQPDGTLKLDQIMDILKLANETVSGSIALEETETKEDPGKVDQLKDLIRGLSEKVGLGSPESSKTAFEIEGQHAESQGQMSDFSEVEAVEDIDEEAVLEEIDDFEDEDVLEDAGDIKEDEIFESVEDVEDLDEDAEDIEEIDDDEIIDDLGDIEIDEVDAVEDVEDLDENVEDIEEIYDDEIVEDVEDVAVDGVSGVEADGMGEGADPDDGIETAPDKDGSELTSLEEADDGDKDGTSENRFKGKDGRNEYEPLGLPVDSLGQEYSIEVDGKIKKNRLLAEEFDGYLGSMDRYYNQYILIPGGEYLFGSKQSEKDGKPEEIVRLEPFYFGRFPITKGLFEIFVEKTGYKTTAEKVGYGTVYYGRFEKKEDAITGLITSIWNSSLYCKRIEGACWYRPSGPESSLHNRRNHPVVQISMEDAMAFAAWTGKRLPTEKEWEAASRTANGWIFPWGQEWEKDACNIEDSCTADTTPVDKYVKFENDFGVVDAMGNVLEWTHDNFDPMSIKNNDSKHQIVKGGSWVSGNDIRLFSRFSVAPESHSNILGFRCVAY